MDRYIESLKKVATKLVFETNVVFSNDILEIKDICSNMEYIPQEIVVIQQLQEEIIEISTFALGQHCWRKRKKELSKKLWTKSC